MYRIRYVGGRMNAYPAACRPLQMGWGLMGHEVQCFVLAGHGLEC